MNRLRWKLVLVFLAATLVPLAVILWVSSALMERSLAFVHTDDVARLSASLERVAREHYRHVRGDLQADVTSGRLQPERLPAMARSTWPGALQQFWDSGDQERFVLSEPAGDRLLYLVRRDGEVWRYSRDLDGVRMTEVTEQLQRARSRAGDLQRRDLPRGFTLALIVFSAGIWVLSLAVILFLASRISTPIEQLTAGLAELASGRLETRIDERGRAGVARAPRRDETGRAIEAFNHTAEQLSEQRKRLVYLTQIASWQVLARKMAHELKNSLTPIRLTVEEILARQPSPDPAFLAQAARIVADEVDSLQRRLRAFSEFAAEPPDNPTLLYLNVLLEERVRLLRVAHPDVTYEVAGQRDLPAAWGDADRVKGILTNLLENAAEAAGPGGIVRAMTVANDRKVVVEVHDSGPGLSEEARAMLFEPSISFKKHGMGLGLAISRKNALLAGGDLVAIEGRLGGAGFRLLVPQPGASSEQLLARAAVHQDETDGSRHPAAKGPKG